MTKGDHLVALPLTLDIEIVHVSELEKAQYAQLWNDDDPSTNTIRRIGGCARGWRCGSDAGLFG